MCMLQEIMIQITRYTCASLVQMSPTVDSSVVNKEQYYFNLQASDLFTMQPMVPPKNPKRRKTSIENLFSNPAAPGSVTSYTSLYSPQGPVYGEYTLFEVTTKSSALSTLHIRTIVTILKWCATKELYRRG